MVAMTLRSSSPTMSFFVCASVSLLVNQIVWSMTSLRGWYHRADRIQARHDSRRNSHLPPGHNASATAAVGFQQCPSPRGLLSPTMPDLGCAWTGWTMRRREAAAAGPADGWACWCCPRALRRTPVINSRYPDGLSVATSTGWSHRCSSSSSSISTQPTRVHHTMDNIHVRQITSAGTYCDFHIHVDVIIIIKRQFVRRRNMAWITTRALM